MDKRRAFTKAAFKMLTVLLTVAGISEVIFIRTTEAISIFTVTHTNDGGAGSLRQAILNANATPGFDIISFSIPGSGVKTILPMTPLPPITDSVFIDGWSQGGLTYSGPPLIEISGINVQGPPQVAGLRIGCIACPDGASGPVDNSSLRGLTVNGFGNFAAGISINGSSNVVRGCYIGTAADGEAALPNAEGIVIFGDDNVIGGITAGARNVVSGNQGEGIRIVSDNNRIQGNYIGLSASGLVALGNGNNGVQIIGSNNLVGGSSAAARNIISGNSNDGIELVGFHLEDGSNNRIEGNYIGTKPDGLSGGVGNHNWGVHIETSFARNTVIGGPFPSFGNVISGNGGFRSPGGGIKIDTSEHRVQNNLIGVGADRQTNLGNIGEGILILSEDNLIGGGGGSGLLRISLPAGNLIAFNSKAGIHVFDHVFIRRNRISANAIHSNGLGPSGGLGIDLGPIGVTANDFCDADTGGNRLQNFPVITSVTPAPGGGITIAGSVNGTSTNYRVEVFNNQNCDPSGNGEGEQFIGGTTAISAKLLFCRAFFVVTLPNITIGEAKFITATATDPDGNTSEFSACFDVH